MHHLLSFLVLPGWVDHDVGLICSVDFSLGFVGDWAVGGQGCSENPTPRSLASLHSALDTRAAPKPTRCACSPALAATGAAPAHRRPVDDRVGRRVGRVRQDEQDWVDVARLAARLVRRPRHSGGQTKNLRPEFLAVGQRCAGCLTLCADRVVLVGTACCWWPTLCWWPARCFALGFCRELF